MELKQIVEILYWISWEWGQNTLPAVYSRQSDMHSSASIFSHQHRAPVHYRYCQCTEEDGGGTSVCQKLQASSLPSALAKQTAVISLFSLIIISVFNLVIISVFNLIIISVFNLQCRELTENPFLLKKRNLCSQANRAWTRNKIVTKLEHSAPQEAAVCTIYGRFWWR